MAKHHMEAQHVSDSAFRMSDTEAISSDVRGEDENPTPPTKRHILDPCHQSHQSPWSSWGLWPLIFLIVILVLKGHGFVCAMSVMSWNSHKYAQLVYLTAFLICQHLLLFDWLIFTAIVFFRGGFLLWLGFFFYINLIFFYVILQNSAIPRPHTISLLCDGLISHREGCISSMPLEARRYAFTASGTPVVTAPVITSTWASKR